MKICDFPNSYFHFRIDLEQQPAITVSHKPPFTMNHVRIPLECRCVVTDMGTNESTQYVLGAACKTERVGVDRDLWTAPNADFCPVVSENEFLIIKSWDRCEKNVMLYPPTLGVQPARQVGKPSEAWALHRTDLRWRDGEALDTKEEVIETVFKNMPLVARTEFEIAGDRRVLLEYPVKTINVSDRDTYYQVDTGPVLFPDMTIGEENMIANLRLAYVAHNSPDWAEFILNVPTPLTDEVSVNHYSEPRRVDVRNTMIRASST